jgi:hypothetical protein
MRSAPFLAVCLAAIAGPLRAQERKDSSRGNRCRASFSAEAFVSGLSAGKSSETIPGSPPESVKQDALYYFLYKALGARDPEQCAPLRIFDHAMENGRGNERRMRGDWLCRDYYFDIALSEDYIARSPHLVQACKDNNRYETPSSTDADLEAICQIVVKYRDDPAALCAQQVARYRNPNQRTKCEDIYRGMNGDAAACGPLASGSNWFPDGKTRCAANVAFNKAFAAKDPALCLDSEICRVMMGEDAAARRSHEMKMAETVCGPL